MNGSDDVNMALILIAGTAGMLALAVGIVLFVIYYQKRMLQNKVDMQQMEADYQKELLKASINSQEKERGRIARDLHDEVGAVLSAVKINLNLLLRKVDKDDQLSTTTHEAKEMVDETINSVRRISRDLLPPTLKEFGLASAINELCSRANAPEIVSVDFIGEESEQRFEIEKELSIYRVVQELLNNALKHAEAKNISVKYAHKAGQLLIDVEDNGTGFDFKEAKDRIEPGKGIGLTNIESRVNAINGEINFDSVKGSGTTVSLLLKLDY